MSTVYPSGGDDPPPPVKGGQDTSTEEDRSPEPSWHADFGLRWGYTKLASTKQQLDRRLELPLKLDYLNWFDKPYTPLDRKTDLGLNTYYFGIGRRWKDWLTWTWYVGGGVGADHDHQRVLNVNLDIKFDYAAVYSGVGLEVYPWGTPEHLNGSNWLQSLRASRPFLVGGAELGYVSAEGRGDYSIAPFRIYADKVVIRDWLVSFVAGMGWAIPLDAHWSMNFGFHHSFHLYRPEEYNSWNFLTAVRYRF